MPLRLLLGDCIEQMRLLEVESVDALVSDPPYGIGFMGREWDTFTPEYISKRQAQSVKDTLQKHSPNANLRGRTVGAHSTPSGIEYDYTVKGLRGFQAWTELWAREAFRVLKPGAHAVVCGAPRAYHRMASGLEDAGFEIRDCLAWLFGSGFPKSLNLGEGLGTALKPAHEPIVLARKPFKGTVKANVETHGTGALNIDACRIGDTVETWPKTASYGRFDTGSQIKVHAQPTGPAPAGRWPANVCLDEIAAMVLDEQSGELVSGANPTTRGSDKFRGIYSAFKGQEDCSAARGEDIGGASRFYYVAKPSREERDYGCLDQPTLSAGACTHRADGSAGLSSPRAGAGRTSGHKNFHPTVKPVELMRWLVKLVTPINGVVLDPFMGSGTTGMACRYEQRSFIGIEREAEYLAIAERRIAAVAPLFASEVAK